VIEDLLPRFEVAVIGHHQLLAGKLRAGLPREIVGQYLRRHRVEGDIDDIISIFVWKNGTRLDPELAASKRGFFPGKPYYLLDLEMAVGHLDHTRLAAQKHVRLAAGLSYFPLFWDGSTTWIAADTTAHQENRVIVADHRAEHPFREISESLRSFFTGAIAAIRENRDLHLG
jgi:hypothetical protein